MYGFIVMVNQLIQTKTIVISMNDKIIAALLAILIALSGWSLTTTVGLKSDVAVLKEKVSGIENEIQNSKAFKGKKKRKKKKTND